MKIPLIQITAAPREVDFAERFHGPKIDGIDFVSPLKVRLTYHRSGQDLFFDGMLTAELEGVCSRCLDAYRFHMEKKFDFVLIPDNPPINKNRGLSPNDMGLSGYHGEEIDLDPFITEQAVLAIPLRPLCDDACLGLCPQCGVDRNAARCDCDVSAGDGRMAVFRSLRVHR